MAVQPSDLPPGYQAQSGSGPSAGPECVAQQSRGADAPTAELRTLGIQACFAAAFKKEAHAGSETATNEPGSVAFLFADADAASRALPVVRRAGAAHLRPTGVATLGPPERLAVSKLGDQWVPGLRYRVQVGPGPLNLVFYFWRVRNVVVEFGGSTALGDMNAKTMLDTARTISSRATR